MKVVSLVKKILKSFDRKYYQRVSIWLWLYSSYLTLRYLDEWNVFPAFQFNEYFKLKIYKGKRAKIKVLNRLVCESWIKGKNVTILSVSENAELKVENDFVLGDDIKISIASNGKLLLKGKENETASGITAKSIILVYKYVEIGYDCIIAWDTFITDCDWHSIQNKKSWDATVIGDHVWIGVGAKILKGVTIGKNSIVTSNSVVIRGEYPERSLVNGIPGKVVKNEIGDWSREMKDV